MNSGSKVLLGVLAGVAAGAVLGILLAPEKGDVTRQKISDNSKDITSSLKDRFAELVDGIADKYETVRESANDLLYKGKAKVATTAENVEDSNFS